MKKLSFVVCCALFATYCLAQPVARHVFVPVNSTSATLIPVKKGDVFDVRTTVSPTPKRHFWTGVLGALGIAAVSYQTKNVEQAKFGTAGSKRPYLLPGIGLGVGAVAMELLGNKKHAKASLKYALYNKDSVPVAVGMATKPRKGELVVHGTAPADGFLQVSVMDKKGVLPNDVAVDITPTQGSSTITDVYAVQSPPVHGGGGVHTMDEHELEPVTVYPDIVYYYLYDIPTGTGTSSGGGTGNGSSGGGGGTGGGGSGAGPTAGQPAKVSAKFLKNPCLKSTLSKIFDTTKSNTLMDQYKKYFGAGSLASLWITEANTTNADGSPSAAGSLPFDTVNQRWTIQVNPSFTGFASTAFMATAIAHELAHYLVNNFAATIKATDPILYDSLQVPLQVHKFMIANFTDGIADLLMQTFGLSQTDAYALALTGYDDVYDSTKNPGINVDKDFINTQFHINYSSISTIGQQYANGMKGNPCPGLN